MRGALAILTMAAWLAPALAHAQEQAPEATAAPEAYAPVTAENVDPWEGFNRAMFATHEAVDQAVLEPVARGYRAVTPTPVRNSVRAFLRNLRSPVIFANDVMQGEFSRAGRTAVRFGLNTTVGFLGLFDPATGLGIEGHSEDFGQTLAVWGVEQGPYLFIPLMGPSTVRDSGGGIVDAALNPLRYSNSDDVERFNTARIALTALSARESVLDAVEDIRRDSMDPYVSIRTSYLLLRQSAIQNGRMNVQDLPEFDDTYDLYGDEAGTETNVQHPEPNNGPSLGGGLAEPIQKPTSPEPSGVDP